MQLEDVKPLSLNLVICEQIGRLLGGLLFLLNLFEQYNLVWNVVRDPFAFAVFLSTKLLNLDYQREIVVVSRARHIHTKVIVVFVMLGIFGLLARDFVLRRLCLSYLLSRCYL